VRNLLSAHGEEKQIPRYARDDNPKTDRPKHETFKDANADNNNNANNNANANNNNANAN
jgi:hypothetical protein